MAVHSPSRTASKLSTTTLLPLLLAAVAAAQDSGQDPSLDPTLDTAPVAADEVFGEPWLLGQFQVDVYGYIKADAVSNTSQTSNGEFTRWVAPPVAGQGNRQFNMTAKQSRLGLNIKAPEAHGITTYGKLELDFFDLDTPDSTTPNLRHAFINLDWEDSDLSLLAGQTSDVISPLVATTVNYTGAWWSGDVGFRRAQVRLTKGLATGEQSKLLVQLALTQSNTNELTAGTDARNGGYGVQGRAAYSFPGLGGRKTTIGLSAHTSEEAAETTSSSGNLDLDVPFTAAFGLQGEYYRGKNMAPYLGGIGQSGDATGDVESSGYWGNLYFQAGSDLSLHLGYAVDDPDDGDLAATGGTRTNNSVLWVNAFQHLTPNTIVAVELARHDTNYLGLEDTNSTRIQVALIFEF